MITTIGKSAQQISNEIAQAIAAQGGRCVDYDGECVYDNGDGAHCALGQLMPENSKLLTFLGDINEIESCYYGEDWNEEIFFGVNGDFVIDNFELVLDIQFIHDTLNNRHACEGRIEIVESKYNLNMDAWRSLIDQHEAVTQ